MLWQPCLAAVSSSSSSSRDRSVSVSFMGLLPLSLSSESSDMDSSIVAAESSTLRRLWGGALTAWRILCCPRSHSWKSLKRNVRMLNEPMIKLPVKTFYAHRYYRRVVKLLSGKYYFYVVRRYTHFWCDNLLHIFYIPLWIEIHRQCVPRVSFNVYTQRIRYFAFAEPDQL